MKHKEWRERKEEKKGREGKKGLKSGEKEGGGKGEKKFFPCIGPWMLRVSMQVLIKRIQKRGASSFVWRCGRGSFGGVNLTTPQPSCPAALQPCFHVFPLSRQAALVYFNIRRSHQVKVRKRIEKHSTHFFFSTSPPYIHVSPNPPGRLWKGKWSTLFIHLLGSQTKASNC